MNKTPEDGSIYVIAGVDKARFRQRVLPGDKVDIFSKVLETPEVFGNLSVTQKLMAN